MGKSKIVVDLQLPTWVEKTVEFVTKQFYEIDVVWVF